MKALEGNRLVRPGVLVRVKRHARECAGVRFQEEGYRARVLGRVTSSRRKGDWWYVRELATFNVRTALSSWCRVLRKGKA